MKIIFIVVSCFFFIAVLPYIFDSFVDDATKALLFYAGVIILLAGLGDVYDWLERRMYSNQDEIKT